MRRLLFVAIMISGLAMATAGCGGTDGPVVEDADVGGADGGTDIGIDIPGDTNIDIHKDTGADVSGDVLPDTYVDIEKDTGVDVVPDVPVDVDVAVDVPEDTLPDVVPDVPSDADAVDVEGDVDVVVPHNVHAVAGQVSGGALVTSPGYSMKVIVGGGLMGSGQSTNYGLSVGIGTLANQ